MPDCPDTGIELNKEIMALGPDASKCTYCNGDGQIGYFQMTYLNPVQFTTCSFCYVRSGFCESCRNMTDFVRVRPEKKDA